MSNVFKSEKEFEDAIVALLPQKGWCPEIIEYPDEQKLIENWKEILFKNNQQMTALNNCPLTDSEMGQILSKIRELNSPLALNGFINGHQVSIVRDNKDDKVNYGKTVYLKIYERDEIAGGDSCYQIVRQPRFNVPKSIFPERRGDLMLLINGMPLIHIELKNNGHPLSEATNQIQKYHKEGVFTGLFSLVQVFVAMTPEDSIYFANPGHWEKFNPAFFFHWADFDNNPYHDWKDFISWLLNIPMAHQLIGFYTVADKTDGVLKVMRSYQYYAAWEIIKRVTKPELWEKAVWSYEDQLGGYVWHTTGAGKTMTSFKSAQLIADLGAKFADKVVFLLDRIELGNQTFLDYTAFAGDLIAVNDTENTGILKSKLESTSIKDKLIVTSIQKMNIVAKEEPEKIKKATSKKIVFIVDECHRDVFGEMLTNIKHAFNRALYFGFTGTPIFDINKKKLNTTVDIFGSQLHRYSIAEGITDKNVLGFDPYPVSTFEPDKIKEVIALDMAKSATVAEAMADEAKKKVFLQWYKNSTMEMAGHYDSSGKYIKGYEDYLPLSQYHTEEHQKAVVEDIKNHWQIYNAGLFHAILATSSIKEAIEYYRLIKTEIPDMKITALFDPTIDNTGNPAFDKEDGLEEIIKDYNKLYDQSFDFATHPLFKKDVSARLSHKEPYLGIKNQKEEQLDLLIVVNQMLTGFDSKWLNTLYLDKEMEYEGIIQAFSRTNRLYKEEDKPFGIIRYYRRPFTMKNRIFSAFKAYSGDRPADVFVSKLDQNITKMNQIFEDIKPLFTKQGEKEPDFSILPEEPAQRGQFVKLFNQFNTHLEAAKLQGFTWENRVYEVNGSMYEVAITIDEYNALLMRYKELITVGPGGSKGDDIPYDLKGHLVQADTEKIDADFMNSNFIKWIKAREQNENEEVVQEAKDALHKSFASLSKEDQLYASLFLHDIESGDIVIEEGESFRDYITIYKRDAKTEQINKIVNTFALNEELLRKVMESYSAGNDLNANSTLQELLDSVDFDKAIEYFNKQTGKELDPPDVYEMLDVLIREFIIKGGFDLDEKKANPYEIDPNYGILKVAEPKRQFGK